MLKPRLARLRLPSRVTVAVPLVRAVPKTAVSWPLPGTPPVQLPDVLHVPLPLVVHTPLVGPPPEITRSMTLPEDSLKLKLSPESVALSEMGNGKLR